MGSRKGILPVAYVEILTEPGEGTLPPPTKPAAAPAAHSILKVHFLLLLNILKYHQIPTNLCKQNGSLPQSSYLPQYDKPKSTLGSSSPYSTLSRYLNVTKLQSIIIKPRPGSSMSNGTGKPEPTPFRALYNYKPQNDDEVPFCLDSPLSCSTTRWSCTRGTSCM